MCQIERLLDQYHEQFSHACQHVERTICNQCIYKNAKTRLENSPNIQMFCPEPNCTAAFDIKKICHTIPNAATFDSTDNSDRYLKSHNNERKTEFIWCSHENCGSGQFHVLGQNNSPIVTCVLCKRQTCAIHNIKWHKGLTCEEYDRQQQNANLDKQCPKCKSINENSLNSDRIICSICKYEYCSECKTDYKDIQNNGADRHKTTCIHYKIIPQTKKQKSKQSSTCIIL